MIERYVIRLKQSNQDRHWEGYVRSEQDDVLSEVTGPAALSVLSLLVDVVAEKELESKGKENDVR